MWHGQRCDLDTSTHTQQLRCCKALEYNRLHEKVMLEVSYCHLWICDRVALRRAYSVSAHSPLRLVQNPTDLRLLHQIVFIKPSPHQLICTLGTIFPFPVLLHIDRITFGNRIIPLLL